MTESPGNGAAKAAPGRAPPLRTILAAAFVTLTVVAVLIVGSFASYNVYRGRKQAAYNELALKASLAAQAVARGLSGETDLLTVAALVGQKDFSDKQKAKVFLARMLANRKAVRSLAILDRNGGEVARYSRYRANPGSNGSGGRRIKPAEMVVGQPHTGPVWFWPKTNEPFVTMFIPTGTIRGKRPDWVLRADINISFMQRTVKQFTGERRSQAFIVDAAGRLLAHGDTARVLRGETLPPDRVAAIFENTPDQPTQEFENEYGVAMAGLMRELFEIGFITLLVSAVAAAAGILLARRLAAPINGLIEAAERMARGDFATAVPVAGVHEMHVLGDTLKTMAGRLERTMDDLKRENGRRVEAQRDAQHAREEAEHASRAKSKFLAHMSHELRTPLNAVIGFSEALQGGLGGPLNDKQAEYVGDIHDSGKHLLSVIGDVLDLAKIEAGRLELEETEIEIGETLEQSLRFVREQAQNDGVELRAELSDGLFRIRADARMVKQMVVNLLSNAVKFTPKGGKVVLSAGRQGDGISISVADNGVGMAPADIPKALTPFERTDSGKDKEGTGLGLPLVKRMAELHGGDLTLDSAPDVGTTATITFPAERIIA